MSARTVRSVSPAERDAASDRSQRSARIPGLDGLRAFAVLAVIAYHLAPGAVPGGFLGVDVFFVVSGFLITTILLREFDSDGRVSLPRFWVRRARRLLPALGLVVVVSVALARLVNGDLLVGIGRQVLGAATFTTNWWEISAGASYFDQRQPELLRPLWSLAIEEQFYFVWPVLLVVGAVLVGRRGLLARTTLGLAVVSALVMGFLATPGGDPTRAYYGTDSHAFGLLLGVSAAFAWQSQGRLLRRRAARWVPVVAIGGLVVLAGSMRDDSIWAYRGGLAFASVLAVVAVAGCTAGTTGYVRALELPVLRWVGERSYGLYLWHWPIALIVFSVVLATPGTVTWWFGAGLILVLTFVMADLSFRYWETPVRRHGFRVALARARVSVRTSARGRVVAAGLVLAVSATVLAVARAPQESAAQIAVEQGQSVVEQGQSAVDAAAAETDGAGQSGAGAEAPHPVAGTDMIGFGDSVMSAAAPALVEQFPGIDLDAAPIRKWNDAPQVVQAAADAGRLRPVVVLAFGTNGGFQFDGGEEAMRRTLDVVGSDRQVILINSSGLSYWLPDANARLAEIAADYPNTHVVDWFATSQSSPELLHSDRTHPNMAGTEVYAQLIAEVTDTMVVPVTDS
jgi:peptidoglycan/LPS O-acetylase OafA/YrhL